VWSSGPNQFVIEQVSHRPVGTALDVGCGEGRNALWLASLGWQVVGLDFSGVALERAATLARKRALDVSWQQADLTAWHPTAQVALVLIAYVHLPAAERRQLLTTSRSAVLPGGYLLLIGHDLRNLRDGTGGPQDSALLWQPQDVPPDGWQVLRAETAARPVGDLIAWDTVVHLRKPQEADLIGVGVEVVPQPSGLGRRPETRVQVSPGGTPQRSSARCAGTRRAPSRPCWSPRRTAGRPAS